MSSGEFVRLGFFLGGGVLFWGFLFILRLEISGHDWKMNVDGMVRIQYDVQDCLLLLSPGRISPLMQNTHC